MKSTSMDLQGKRNDILRIAMTHGAGNIRVFGSAARGEDLPDSDLDLLVEMDAGRSLLDLVALGQDLEDLLERKVDVLSDIDDPMTMTSLYQRAPGGPATHTRRRSALVKDDHIYLGHIREAIQRYRAVRKRWPRRVHGRQDASGRRTILGAFFLLTSSLLAQSQVGWVDPSPHTQRFVPVDPNTHIEVLDWGGSGRALILLSQLGQSAHIYDDWAPRLAHTYHVLAISRRGYGESSAQPDGYSMDRLGADIVAVLDAEKLPNPILVAHGFAGEEISWIGTHLPQRATGLIYLEAAYDRTRANMAAQASILRKIPPRQPQPQDLENVESVKRMVSSGLGFPLPEAEIRHMMQFAADGQAIGGPRTPATVQQQILSGIVKADYPSIRIPVLAIYARPTSPEYFPGCHTSDTAVRESCAEYYAWSLKHLSDSEKSLRTVRAKVRVIEFRDANQFIFLSSEREVMRAIDSFASSLANARWSRSIPPFRTKTYGDFWQP